MRSLPTYFKGRLYRSLLEAKWASFFDQCGWHYEYEPGSFNGWIPDFVLKNTITMTHKDIFVEIKPTWTFPQEAADKAIGAVAASLMGKDVDPRGWIDGKYLKAALDDKCIMFLGYRLMSIGGEAALGWLGVGEFGDHDAAFKLAGSQGGGRVMIQSDWNYMFRPLQVPIFRDGKHIDHDEAQSLWDVAANKVQWNSVKPESSMNKLGLVVDGESV